MYNGLPKRNLGGGSMNVFNRLLAVIVLLALLALTLLLSIIPEATLQASQNALENVEQFLVGLAGSQRWVYFLGRVGLLIVGGGLSGYLLWREIRPRRAGAVRLTTETGSRATVTLDSVARRLAWNIDQLADVISVQPKVTPRGGAVDVLLDLETRPETDVPMKTDEVVAVATEVLTEQMGLHVGKVRVNIRHGAYQDGS
jgi:hypothetical protein